MDLDTSFLFAILFDKLCQSIMLIWQSIKIVNNNFTGRKDCKVYLKNCFQRDTPGWESPHCWCWAPSQPAGSQLSPRWEEEAQTICQGRFSSRRRVLNWVTLGANGSIVSGQTWSSLISSMACLKNEQQCNFSAISFACHTGMLWGKQATFHIFL